MIRMPHWPIPLWHKPIDLGLERIRGLLKALGNPHEKLPPVIHVAGTNGKGSTIAFLRSILRAGGYRVHCYTSPHLVAFNERILLQEKQITDEFLYEILEECRIAAEKHAIQPTFFEGTTAAAMLAFSRIPADCLLMETGMGGRLDATNVIAKPAATVITPISFDHMEFLGNSLALIAAEKAGIFRPEVPAILSMQYPEAEAMLIAQANRLSSPLFIYGEDWGVTPTENGMRYQSQDHHYDLPLPSLQGEHQLLNAGTAIATLSQITSLFPLTLAQLQKGITTASWPGRIQQLTQGALFPNLVSPWEVWIDGAHNPDGAHVLSLWLETKQDLPVYVIVGMTKGRNIPAFLEYFKGKTSMIFGVTVTAEPSSHKGESVTEAALTLGFTSVTYPTVQSAVTEILHTLPSGRILICGSLYLAGEVLALQQGIAL